MKFGSKTRGDRKEQKKRQSMITRDGADKTESVSTAMLKIQAGMDGFLLFSTPLISYSSNTVQDGQSN